MSQSEIERFQSDIRVRSELAEKVKTDSGHHGLGAIVDTANKEGYDFNLDELKGFVIAKSAGTLSDEQLAKVAAAGSTWTSTSTVVNTYTVAQVIGAAEVAVVAVAVVVLT